MTYYEVKISAENPRQANDILRSLLKERKGEINTMPNYCMIWSYTTDKHKQTVIDLVREVSVE
jgi:Mn-containing catalase